MSKKSEFQNLSAEEKDWLDAHLDGTIDPDAFERFQDRLLENPELRRVARRYFSLDASLQIDQDLLGTDSDAAAGPWLTSMPNTERENQTVVRRSFFSGWGRMAVAAAVAFLLGISWMYFQSSRNLSSTGVLARSADDEPSAQGFAVVGRLYDVNWKSDNESLRERSPREGDTLGAETLKLVSGTAQIQFFSGAMMTVEGPAEIELRSAWEAACFSGAVRMKVPPAARGFKLQALSSEIIDLGTEFGLLVEDGKSHVEVFDGEIAVRHAEEAERKIQKGEALGLALEGFSEQGNRDAIEFPDPERFVTRAVDETKLDFQRWESHRDSLSRDPRLIAFYTFDQDPVTSLIPNLKIPGSEDCEGAVVLAETVAGRWPGLKPALEFRRPGARVRVNLPGEFPAFTFASWVRIDSLDRWYSALFMGDGYETGEPHWQIRDDGAMMLSVMVDDTQENPGAPNDAGFHRVYYSPPMWNLSMSGQWLHLASVFDPENRRVSHYVNGERIHRQEIEDRFFIDTLRIGNAEIGNWGQPFKENPTFAIRNLNGRMDEIAVFGEALQDEAIASLFEQSQAGRK